MEYLVLAIGVIVGFLLGRVSVRDRGKSFAGRKPAKTTEGGSPDNLKKLSREELKEIQKKSHRALTKRTENRKEKILSLMTIGATHGDELKACGVEDIKKGITSKNVKRFLGVSSGTARKYLNELEAEGKIIQVGERGEGVYYTLK